MNINEARGAVVEKNRLLRGADGRMTFPVLVEDEKRRERWRFMLEDGGDNVEKQFDLTVTDEDLHAEHSLPEAEWRRPSWRRRHMESLCDAQMRRDRQLRSNPSLLSEGGDPVVAGGRLNETTTSTPDITPFTTWSLGVLRRFWPQVYVQDLFPSMNMGQPTGRYFFFDALFGSTGESYAANSRVDNVEDPDYSDSPGECANVNELDFQVTGTDIETITKKILSRMSIEAMQDAEAYFGISLDPEAMRHQAMLVAREINRYCIEQVRTTATNTATFDKKVPTTGVYSTIDPHIYLRTLVDSMLDVDTDIYGNVFFRSTWAVMDHETSNILESVESYNIDPLGDGRGRTRISTTPNLFGTFQRRWEVVIDPFLVPDQIVLGSRPPSIADALAVYLTYVAFYALPLFQDPADMCLRRGAIERFAFPILRPEGFGRVNLFESA